MGQADTRASDVSHRCRCRVYLRRPKAKKKDKKPAAKPKPAPRLELVRSTWRVENYVRVGWLPPRAFTDPATVAWPILTHIACAPMGLFRAVARSPCTWVATVWR